MVLDKGTTPACVSRVGVPITVEIILAGQSYRVVSETPILSYDSKGRELRYMALTVISKTAPGNASRRLLGGAGGVLTDSSSLDELGAPERS